MRRANLLGEQDGGGAIAYQIPRAVEVSGLSRTKLYQCIAAGEVEAVKAGARTLILADSLRALVLGLPRNGRKGCANV